MQSSRNFISGTRSPNEFLHFPPRLEWKNLRAGRQWANEGFRGDKYVQKIQVQCWEEFSPSPTSRNIFMAGVIFSPFAGKRELFAFLRPSLRHGLNEAVNNGFRGMPSKKVGKTHCQILNIRIDWRGRRVSELIRIEVFARCHDCTGEKWQISGEKETEAGIIESESSRGSLGRTAVDGWSWRKTLRYNELKASWFTFW